MFETILTASKPHSPIQNAVVLQILCSPTTLHIFDYMIFKKLFQELNSLLPGNLRAKVAVVAEQLVKPIYSSAGGEAARMVPKVLPMFPEGHPSAEQASDLIPLKYEGEISTHIMRSSCKKYFQIDNLKCNYSLVHLQVLIFPLLTGYQLINLHLSANRAASINELMVGLCAMSTLLQ